MFAIFKISFKYYLNCSYFFSCTFYLNCTSFLSSTSDQDYALAQIVMEEEQRTSKNVWQRKGRKEEVGPEHAETILVDVFLRLTRNTRPFLFLLVNKKHTKLPFQSIIDSAISVLPKCSFSPKKNVTISVDQSLSTFWFKQWNFAGQRNILICMVART